MISERQLADIERRAHDLVKCIGAAVLSEVPAHCINMAELAQLLAEIRRLQSDLRCAESVLSRYA